MNSSTKKLIIFWAIAIPLLIGWYFYWQLGTRQETENSYGETSRLSEIKTASDIYNTFKQKDGQERTFLLLFQNNMELRPSGGYIGTFGILKIKDGEIVSIESHNTNIFDGRVPDGTPAPFPFQELIKIKDWKMRDANWFPDFRDSALKAESFYKAGQGGERFDGIIGVNANVLNSVLSITGPISVSGVPEEFNSENGVLRLEYLVEQGYREEGMEQRTDRKSIIKDLAKAIIQKSQALSYTRQLDLLETLEKELNEKDIQLYFKDQELQSKIEKVGWAGRVDAEWEGDYLMVVDANLGAKKSDIKILRSYEYSLDLTKTKPEAILKVTYNHTGTAKDWMTNNYQGYLRAFVPKGSWLESSVNTGQGNFMEEYNKKVFGFIVKAPLSQTTTIEMKYTLPEKFKNQDYQLLIQKQSGLETIPTKIHITDRNGQTHNYEIELTKDYVLEIK